jgi:hypothetical protein
MTYLHASQKWQLDLIITYAGYDTVFSEVSFSGSLGNPTEKETFER